jgi:hypothetical protein
MVRAFTNGHLLNDGQNGQKQNDQKIKGVQ